jgi:hypothetical protein
MACGCCLLRVLPFAGAAPRVGRQAVQCCLHLAWPHSRLATLPHSTYPPAAPPCGPSSACRLSIDNLFTKSWDGLTYAQTYLKAKKLPLEAPPVELTSLRTRKVGAGRGSSAGAK